MGQSQSWLTRAYRGDDVQSVRLMMMLCAPKCEFRSHDWLGKNAYGVPYESQQRQWWRSLRRRRPRSLSGLPSCPC